MKTAIAALSPVFSLLCLQWSPYGLVNNENGNVLMWTKFLPITDQESDQYILNEKLSMQTESMQAHFCKFTLLPFWLPGLLIHFFFLSIVWQLSFVKVKEVFLNCVLCSCSAAGVCKTSSRHLLSHLMEYFQQASRCAHELRAPLLLKGPERTNLCTSWSVVPLL